MVHFGDKLKKLRKQNGYTLKVAAKSSGVAYHTWVAIEYRGRHDIMVTTILKIAKLFGVTIDELIHDTDLTEPGR